MKIAIIEDNDNLRFAIELLLKHNGYKVHGFANQHKFFEKIDELDDGIDIFIIDINLPDGDGLELLDVLKRYFNDSVYIVISAYTDMSHISNAYNIGADDYLKKPFQIEELLLKIKKIETQRGISNIIKIDDIYSFDQDKNILYKYKEIVPLSKNETKIFIKLLNNRNKIVSLEDIAHSVWEKDVPANTIIVTLKRLREKLETQFIYNVHGAGYMLKI